MIKKLIICILFLALFLSGCSQTIQSSNVHHIHSAEHCNDGIGGEP